ncbi:HMG domain-containing protein 3-like [Carassius carassius]|uniref:HMG domain-containing protein 3-like n=1 Tax=Carassius carassius TaxID=217509 RepID=UPI002868A671|nr:HMG domain-containing protein 3-like [Carassius carassius]
MNVFKKGSCPVISRCTRCCNLYHCPFCETYKTTSQLSIDCHVENHLKLAVHHDGISTYYKVCSNCSMMYRYQEFTDGIHNFNDHLLLSLHLCLIFRNALHNHTAVSRVMSILEATAKAKFPSKDTVLHGYLHFEALSSHDYSYTCINCGYHPKVVIMDLHKKGVFSIPFSEIATPPSEFKGDTNIVSFWESVTMEMIGRGFLSSESTSQL